jgi:hypothetical protein
MQTDTKVTSEASEITRLNRQYNTLKNERDKSWLPRYRDIRRYVCPDDGMFEGDLPNDPKYNDSRIINPYPRKALNTLRSGMLSGMTSPSSQWFKLTVPHEVALSDAVTRWLYDVQLAMSELMIKSNLYNVLPMVYGSMAAYGTAVMTVMPDRDDIVRCTHYPAGTYMLNINSNNVVDTMYRTIPMTAKMMVDQFGLDRVSPSVKTQHEMGAMTWNTVYQAIEPNPNYDPDKIDSASMRYQSTYWEAGNQTNFLSRGGFRRFPAMCPRWDVNGNNVYGTGPAFVALGKCKELQVLEADKLRMIRTGANPSMTAPVSLRGQKATTQAGEITWMPDNQVGLKFAPTYVPDRAWIQEIRNEIDQCEQDIGGAFFADLFLMISQLDSNMTAYEVSVRKEEKMLMLGPVLERSDDELLDPLIDAFFEIMWDQSVPIWQGLMEGVPLIQPPPEELQNIELKVEYISILAQAQKMTGVSNIERAVGFTLNTMQAIPSAADMLNADQATIELYKALGVPPSMLNSLETVGAKREAQAQQQAQMQKIAETQAAAETGKMMSETNLEGDNALTAMAGQ